jgi:hypothetical protein
MANVVVLGLSGQDKLWVADLEAGTILPMDEESGVISASELRKSSQPMGHGVDFAVSLSSADDSAGGLYERSENVIEAAGGLYERSESVSEAAGGLYERSPSVTEAAGGLYERSPSVTNAAGGLYEN